MQVDYSQVNQAVLALAQREAARFADGATATSQAQTSQAIAEWIATGGTLPDLISQVRRTWEGARPDVAAVTELTRIYATGNAAAWEASGVVRAVTWRTTNDALVCPICGPLADTEVDFDGELPPAHPNCRCWISPVVKGPEELGTAEATTEAATEQPARMATEAEMLDWAQRGGVTDWRTTVSDDERGALQDYQHTAYKYVNPVLREGGTPDAEDQAWIDGLDSALAKTTVQQPVVTYRGFSTPEVIDNFDNLTGATISDLAYTSTSLSEAIGQKYMRWAQEEGVDSVLAEIMVPQGAHGAYLAYPDSGLIHLDEQELLLPRDTQFRVVSTRIDPDGTKRIVLEVIT